MLTGELKPFQNAPVDAFLSRGSLLVSFDMGLGKTPIAIACAEELLGCGDISLCLIVCPPSLKYQWAERLAQFTDGADQRVIDGTAAQRKAQYQSITKDTDYVVIGYPNVTSDSRYVRAISKEMVVLDEVTAIKTFKAKRTKDTKRLLKARYRLGLTGTPMENGKPEEIYSIMQWVDSSVLGRWDLFDQSYIRRRRGTDIVKGYKNLPVLHDRLKVAVSRKSRDDEDVRPYLPSVEQDEWAVPLEGPLREAYMQMGLDLYHGLKASHLSGDFNLFAHYHGEGANSPDGRLMSIHMCMEMLLNHPDLVIESAMRYEKNGKGSKYAYEVWQQGLLDDVFDTPKAELLKEKVDAIIGYGNKCLVYTKYRTGLPYLQAILQGHEAVLYHGQMNAIQKAEAVVNFANPLGPNLFLSSWAGAYGCDMNMARHLINFDNPWSAGTADQINGRHVRLSNEFKQVYIHTMYVSGTIEERMLDQQEHKRKVNAAIVDGRGADRMGRIDNSVESLTHYLEKTILGEDLGGDHAS